jgi:threonine synthase
LKLEKTSEDILTKILDIFPFKKKNEDLEKIVDPYITQNIISHLNSLSEFKDKIASILSIEL